MSSASVSSVFSNDSSKTAGQIKTKLYLGPPGGCIDFFSFSVSFDIILKQQNNCFTPCWSIVKKNVALGNEKDEMNY